MTALRDVAAQTGRAVGMPRTVALVADRSVANRTALAEVIHRFDPEARVIETGSGQRIIDTFTGPTNGHARPTIAFVSVQLDDLTGPEAIAMVKARGCEIPGLILVSGRVVPKWTEVAQRLDAYEFLKSPLDPDHVVQLLEAERRRRMPTRILVVDSSPNGRALVARVLERSGFSLEVEETDDGRHALKLLRLAQFDLVLIDLALQGLDGLEIACQAHDVAPATPLILMSSGDVDSLAQASRHFGVAFVLKKPFYARDIDLALHHVLGLRRPYLLNALVAGTPGILVRANAEAPQALRA
jgi:CheY-like chemotaxis protein